MSRLALILAGASLYGLVLRSPETGAGAARSAPIPDAVADNIQPDDPESPAGGKEIPDVEALGKAFVKPIPKEARSGSFKPKGSDPWTLRPIALEDGWHHDAATGWSFLIAANRLREAKSDEAMADQPPGTQGRAFRA